jgi:hypothetical protein
MQRNHAAGARLVRNSGASAFSISAQVPVLHLLQSPNTRTIPANAIDASIKSTETAMTEPVLRSRPIVIAADNANPAEEKKIKA